MLLLQPFHHQPILKWSLIHHPKLSYGKRLFVNVPMLQFAGSNTQNQNDCANLTLLSLEIFPLLSNCLLQVPLFFLPEMRKRSWINDWVITVSHKSGTSSSATNMRHRVTSTVQEFCPDSSILFLSSKNKKHQSAASISQTYCSRLNSNFTRVNWPNLKQWALIQWQNTEGRVWNDWLTHYIKMKFSSIILK